MFVEFEPRISYCENEAPKLYWGLVVVDNAPIVRYLHSNIYLTKEGDFMKCPLLSKPFRSRREALSVLSKKHNFYKKPYGFYKVNKKS